jgi:hypothetical protein
MRSQKTVRLPKSQRQKQNKLDESPWIYRQNIDSLPGCFYGCTSVPQYDRQAGLS